jgi:hypothetical protein
MGTRADFYVENEWIGSIAYDGYPDGIDSSILQLKDKEEFETKVKDYISKRADGTLPVLGWPWPWTNSSGTDYSYIFTKGCVYISRFGSDLWPAEYLSIDLCPKTTEFIKYFEFPDMSSIQNVTFDGRSGLMVFSSKAKEE